MGIGTVFIGLICIVFICMILSAIVTRVSKPQADASAAKPSAAEVALPSAEKQAVIAGACACIAEELGTDASNIKVVSFKRI